MSQVNTGYPYQIMGGVYALAGQVAALAAVAEGNYVGANTTVTISNNWTETGIIPARGITIGANQRIECCIFYKFTGATLNVAQANIASYQRIDAFADGSLNIPEIVLKPGERLAIRIFNRAPAAAANITVTVHYFAIEDRTFNQYVSNQRREYDKFAGVY